MMTPERRAEILAHDSDFITASIRRAVRQAIEENYRAGNSITIWRDGAKVVIPPEEIPALLAAECGEDDGYRPLAPEETAERPISAPNR